jgi:membrane protein implicated in regulation of membrane protease activity
VPELRESSLSQLKYPLVFFGLGLLVVEAAFGAALATSSGSVQLVIILSSWMGGLFLISILVVAFLVYKVPTHIMLESQKELNRERTEMIHLQERLHRASLILEEAQEIDVDNSSDLVRVLNLVRQALFSEPK